MTYTFYFPFNPSYIILILAIIIALTAHFIVPKEMSEGGEYTPNYTKRWEWSGRLWVVAIVVFGIFIVVNRHIT